MSSPKKWWQPDWVLVLVLLAGSFLILSNLDEAYLWTDEAEAAVLAESILEHGLPTAFDGRNYLTQWVVAKREDFNDEMIWVLSPWLQLYVSAASFAVFGVNTLAARLPFALVGIACLWMIYKLAKRATHDKRIARTASLLLLTSIPFLLHSRQGRYYPIAMFATMWIVHAYIGMLERKKWSTAHIIVAISILFHANYGLCLPVLGALVLHALIYAWNRARPWQVLVVPAGIAALTLPWALYTNILSTGSRLDLTPYFYNFFHYVHAVNRWAMPLVLPVAFLVLRTRGWKSRVLSRSNLGTTAAATIGLFSVAFVSINVGLFSRYVIHTIPLFVFLSACLVIWLVDALRQRFGMSVSRVAWLLVPVMMFTTVLPWPFAPILRISAMDAPHKGFQDNPAVRNPLTDYEGPQHEIFELIEEITSPYDGPLERVAKFLNANARPEHTLFIDYGDVPLLFYTDLIIRGGLQGIPYHGSPEWIVSRSNRAGIAVNSLRQFAESEGYIQIVLQDTADTRWENRPDPYVHFYRTPPVGNVPRLTGGVYPPVVLYMRSDLELSDSMGARVSRTGGKR
ncbi:MAG: hypothetical protein ACI8TQ_002720 [Planctomycetota bacterium]|jgi:hypothetical protein